MPDTTARLGLPVLAASQAQKHVTHNEALQQLDTVVQLVLVAVDSQTPPLLPQLGETYALGPAPTGAWAGQGGKLAQWQFDQWQFISPQDGWRAWDQAAGGLRICQAGVWQDLLQNLPGLGIGTGFDTQNLLAVAAPASLFTHAGAGHQVKINKAAAGDSASLLYQSGWTGHVEMGLTGDNDFHLKTSADGSTWTEALVVNAGSGLFSGSGVQAHAADPTPGRLLVVGGFGLGLLGDAPALADIDDTAMPSGSYQTRDTTANMAGLPSAWGVLTARRFSAAVLHQTWQGNAGPDLWTRRYAAGGWSAWHKLYSQANLLGPVAQTAGSPTGAVIESGSGANGHYIRFADGLQLCHHSQPALTTGDASWTLPAAFIDSNYQMSGNAKAVALPRVVTFGTASPTTLDFSAFDLTAARTDAQCALQAIGRWY